MLKRHCAGACVRRVHVTLLTFVRRIPHVYCATVPSGDARLDFDPLGFDGDFLHIPRMFTSYSEHFTPF